MQFLWEVSNKNNTKFFPYNLVLCKGITKQPRLYMVLRACEVLAGANHLPKYLCKAWFKCSLVKKQLSTAISLDRLEMFSFLKGVLYVHFSSSNI